MLNMAEFIDIIHILRLNLAEILNNIYDLMKILSRTYCCVNMAEILNNSYDLI